MTREGDQKDDAADDQIAHMYPSEEDKIFRPEVRPSPVPCEEGSTVSQYQEGPPYYFLREGYYRAGEILASRLEQSPRVWDVWPGIVYPMLHCFRHYVEISLKDLIREYAEVSDEPIRIRLESEHNLMNLWNELRHHLGKGMSRWAGVEQAEEHVGRCINELNLIDPSSQTFRYATDKSGISTTSRVPTVELRQLMQTMARLRHYFVDLDLEAEVLADQMAAYLESMPDEFGN